MTQRKLIHKFDSWMIEALQKHVDAGGSVGSFSGANCISHTEWSRWVREIPELRAIQKVYLEGVQRRRSFMARACE